MKEIIVDFENEVVFFKLESQQGTEFNFGLNQLQTMNTLSKLEDSVYISLCKSSIIGFDFENNLLKTYKPISFDISSGALYPSHKLQQKNEYIYPNLKNMYEEIYTSLGYEIINISSDIEEILQLINETQ